MSPTTFGLIEIILYRKTLSRSFLNGGIYNLLTRPIYTYIANTRTKLKQAKQQKKLSKDFIRKRRSNNINARKVYFDVTV